MLRVDTRLYLPSLSNRRGFSSSRVEHLLNNLVRLMPLSECYLEIGVLEGRTLDAASAGNVNKSLMGCDPCDKYGIEPDGFSPNVRFIKKSWRGLSPNDFDHPVGLVFYDGDHGARATADFMQNLKNFPLAREVVLVLDDWDRESVRKGSFIARGKIDGWQLLREMPEYTDGLTTTPHHFGYQFGVGVWGYRP